MNTNFIIVCKEIFVVFLVFIENYCKCWFMNIFQSKFQFSATEHPQYSILTQ